MEWIAAPPTRNRWYEVESISEPVAAASPPMDRHIPGTGDDELQLEKVAAVSAPFLRSRAVGSPGRDSAVGLSQSYARFQ